MIHIDEWDIPEWITLDWESAPQPARLPRLVDTICRALERVEHGPRVVHFHGGEGLRWIRVGFAHDRTLKTEDVQRVGQAIAAQVGEQDGPLYFHALRPRDLVFFLPLGAAARVDLDPAAVGMPLDDVLRAWGLEPALAQAPVPHASA